MFCLWMEKIGWVLLKVEDICKLGILVVMLLVVFIFILVMFFVVNVVIVIGIFWVFLLCFCVVIIIFLILSEEGLVCVNVLIGNVIVVFIM